MYKIIFPPNDKLFVEKHKDIQEWKEDIIIMWGGRFGAKSESIARHLTKKSLTQSYFKCVLARKVKDTVKDSNFDQIRSFINDAGLADVFKVRKSPLEIETEINYPLFRTSVSL